MDSFSPLKRRVSDPYSFFTDPDPDPAFKMNTDPDPDPAFNMNSDPGVQKRLEKKS